MTSFLSSCIFCCILHVSTWKKYHIAQTCLSLLNNFVSLMSFAQVLRSAVIGLQHRANESMGTTRIPGAF